MRLGSTACSSHLHGGDLNLLSCWPHLGLIRGMPASHCGVRDIRPRINPLALIGFAFRLIRLRRLYLLVVSNLGYVGWLGTLGRTIPRGGSQCSSL